MNPHTTSPQPPPHSPPSPPLAPRKPPPNPAPPAPQTAALAASNEALMAACVEIAIIEYGIGGDPVLDREAELLMENPGKTRREVEALVEGDEILRRLGERGLARR
ncbi:uncharacterized protein RSE6_08123 [Rhynchosporium secalis]|uniref:Uncharacterized protein n=1 Tax=Rhynchosporium secalis TaxID=38038 RepID=A0A1E1MEN1_RHYSE|nr:uncharacterized protein RSE6_08123 [Rhynchosporium secalis]